MYEQRGEVGLAAVVGAIAIAFAVNWPEGGYATEPTTWSWAQPRLEDDGRTLTIAVFEQDCADFGGFEITRLDDAVEVCALGRAKKNCWSEMPCTIPRDPDTVSHETIVFATPITGLTLVEAPDALEQCPGEANHPWTGVLE